MNINNQETYNEFISGFKDSAGFSTTNYANEVWAGWSRQLSDSARAAVEKTGYKGGIKEGKIFARLNTPATPATPKYKWLIVSFPGMPPWGYAHTVRDALKLQKSARRQGLDGGIQPNHK